MRRFLALAALPLALAAPAAAQESPDLIAIAALIVGGLADGQSTMAGGTAAVTSPAPGTYVATQPSGIPLTFNVTQPAPCDFDVALQSDDDPVTIHFDANKMRSLGVLLLEEKQGLFAYRITFSGTEGRLLIETTNSTFPPPVDTWPVVTSVDLQGVQTAIGLLRKACPGLAE